MGMSGLDLETPLKDGEKDGMVNRLSNIHGTLSLFPSTVKKNGERRGGREREEGYRGRAEGG